MVLPSGVVRDGDGETVIAPRIRWASAASVVEHDEGHRCGDGRHGDQRGHEDQPAAPRRTSGGCGATLRRRVADGRLSALAGTVVVGRCRRAGPGHGSGCRTGGVGRSTVATVVRPWFVGPAAVAARPVSAAWGRLTRRRRLHARAALARRHDRRAPRRLDGGGVTRRSFQPRCPHGPGGDLCAVRPQPLPQGGGQRLPRLEALGWILGQDRAHEAVEQRRQLGVERAHGRYRRGDVLHEHGRQGVAFVGHAPGERLEEHHAQRVDVAAAVDGDALGLLRRHVVGRAHDGAGGGVLRDADDLGDAVVGEHRFTLRREQHVGRLDVAVDHATPMGVVDRRAERLEESQHLGGRQATRPGGQRRRGAPRG